MRIYHSKKKSLHIINYIPGSAIQYYAVPVLSLLRYSSASYWKIMFTNLINPIQFR